MGELVVVVVVAVVAVGVVLAVRRARAGRARGGAEPPHRAGADLRRTAGRSPSDGPALRPEVLERPTGAELAQEGGGRVAGAPAGGATEPTAHRPEAPPTASLHDLLAGIEWPCGLGPVTGADEPGGDRYRALVTADVPPDDVGAAMGDELERLGFRLHSLSDDEVVARRGEDLLSLRLHPDATEAEPGGRSPFPGAAAGAVGIEVWVGAGPNPRHA
jgi:hypothetical protein